MRYRGRGEKTCLIWVRGKIFTAVTLKKTDLEERDFQTQTRIILALFNLLDLIKGLIIPQYTTPHHIIP